MSSGNYGYVTTIGGYAALLTAGFLIYATTQRNKKRPATSQPKGNKANYETKKEPKPKKQRVERPRSPATGTTWGTSNVHDTSEDDTNNKEFAKQLSSVKEGTKFAAKTGGDSKKQKSVKQSRAAQVDEFDNGDDGRFSAQSSTAGGDADDDQSPAVSPEVKPADHGGVSDMLEAPAPGPSTLRLVDTEPAKPQKPKKEKAPEPTETKKQRQNKKKADAAKVAREEAEKERKVKMEAQRRLARESEGRPAKDGSQFMAALNGANAWKKGVPNGAKNEALKPLDTYDAPAASSKPAAPSKDESWKETLLSEEEQMELLKSETEEWSTVQSSKTKKAKKDRATPEEKETVEATAAPQPAEKPKPAPSSDKPSKPIVKTFGSFSALSTEDTDEKEWDV